MMAYFEDEKFIEEGIAYPFKTHVQSTIGCTNIVDVHYHHHIEILYALSGKYSLYINGETHFFDIGDMVVINAMETHSVASLFHGLGEYIVIRFQPEFLYTTAQSLFESKYVLPFTMSQSTHQRVFKSGDIQGTHIPGLLKAISQEDKQRAYGFELAIRTHLGQLFLWILRYWHTQGLDLNIDADIKKSTIERFQGAFDYVAEHYDHPIQASDMAAMCNMSYSYFCRVFKQIMGRSFTEYLNFIRLSRAEHLLVATDFTVTEVALAVGYTTSSYFISQFKAHKGMTPKQFKEKIVR